MFISDLRQVGCSSLDTPVSCTNKTDRHDITEILLKVTLNTISQGLTLAHKCLSLTIASQLCLTMVLFSFLYLYDEDYYIIYKIQDSSVL